MSEPPPSRFAVARCKSRYQIDDSRLKNMLAAASPPGYHHSMRRIFRHALILTITFALVASAAAWRECTALQLAAATAANSERVSHAAHHHADAAGHNQHDRHAMHHQQVADDPATLAADDQGCMKCCTMCTVANALPPAANMAVIFTVSAHMFSHNQDMWFGNTIAVDPGIPKRIA